MKKVITVFTDGACQVETGDGGWGVYHEGESGVIELLGGSLNTTNNRMELTAAIQAIVKFSKPGVTVEIVTDSNYVKLGITQWIKRWQINGWRTADRKPVANQDLWLDLLSIKSKASVNWKWVRAHSGIPGNERADFLARNGILIAKGAFEELAKNAISVDKAGIVTKSEAMNDNK